MRGTKLVCLGSLLVATCFLLNSTADAGGVRIGIGIGIPIGPIGVPAYNPYPYYPYAYPYGYYPYNPYRYYYYPPYYYGYPYRAYPAPAPAYGPCARVWPGACLRPARARLRPAGARVWPARARIRTSPASARIRTSPADLCSLGFACARIELLPRALATRSPRQTFRRPRRRSPTVRRRHRRRPPWRHPGPTPAR